MNLQGFAIFIIVMLLGCSITFAGPFIKKKFPKYKFITNTYWFWLSIGLICFIYLLVIKYVPDWKMVIDSTREVGGFRAASDWTKSKILMTDWCPMIALILPLSLIIDPSRRVARVISPAAILGGLIVCFSFCFSTNVAFTWKCIFLSDLAGNRGMVILHVIQLLLAIGVCRNTPIGGWRNWIASLIFGGGYLLYVYFTKVTYGTSAFLSGLAEADWGPNGEYWSLTKFLHLPTKIMPVLGTVIFLLAACGIVTLKDYVFNKWIWTYGNNFSGCWWHWWDYDHFRNFKTKEVCTKEYWLANKDKRWYYNNSFDFS